VSSTAIPTGELTLPAASVASTVADDPSLFAAMTVQPPYVVQ
jgi:hypothetical protein